MFLKCNKMFIFFLSLIPLNSIAFENNNINDSALNFISKAKEYEKNKDWNNALKNYFHALSLNPNVIESQFGEKIIDFKTPLQLKDKPQWEKDQSIKDKILLIYGVKGIGDTLQFFRFISNLNDLKPKKIIFLSQKGLAELLKNSNNIPKNLPIEIIDDWNNIPEYDLYVSLLSLPHYLNINIADIKSNSYLTLNDNKYSNKFSKYDKIIKIGVIVTGDANHIHNSDRSYSYKMLSNISENKNIKLFSLQYGGIKENISQSLPIEELIDNNSKFIKTVEIMKNLDCIISADTSTAHLAGALGIPTFVPLSKNTDLRYVGEGENTFWYKSVKLIRQNEQGNWKDVFSKIEQMIPEFCHKNN
ncbi:hypothetical protein [Silvanigrella sp.]|jgi:ADP-heptose:LPS heptosyltransferase|uniref:hypothetical protein n=1 Tax=Silvanigrella sp. TaxID=2024976 RepID=UPI0037CBD84F